MATYKLNYSGEKIDEILAKADNMTEVGSATGETAGKVKLSDATDSESGVADGTAATPKAVKAAYDAASAAGKTADDLSTKVEQNTTDIAKNATDVGQLKEDTAKLKDGKISKFYASSQGNTNLPDSDDGRIVDLMLYGKSSQQQYTGKNLLSTLDISTSTKLGVTVKSVGPGEINVKGTATADALFVYRGQEISVPKGARVLCKVLQGTGSANNTVTFFGENYANGISTRFGDISSSAANADYKCVLVRISIKSGETVDCTIGLSLQMDASTDYEPYVGGIPSPNPEYPQEIKSVVKPVVTISDGADKQQTVTLPYTLNAIPVTSGGNVTIDGQQYIADYVDVERGKLVRMVDSSKLDTTQSIIGKTDWLLATPTETDLTADEIAAFKALVSHYPVTNVSTTSDQLDGYTVFNYPISLANGWNYVKQQLGDNRDYIYDMDLQSAEAYVNSEYAVALTELEA